MERCLSGFSPPTICTGQNNRISRKLSCNRNISIFMKSVVAFFSQVHQLSLWQFTVTKKNQKENKDSLFLPIFSHLQANFHKLGNVWPHAYIFSFNLLRRCLFLVSSSIHFIAFSHFPPPPYCIVEIKSCFVIKAIFFQFPVKKKKKVLTFHKKDFQKLIWLREDLLHCWHHL